MVPNAQHIKNVDNQWNATYLERHRYMIEITALFFFSLVDWLHVEIHF